MRRTYHVPSRPEGTQPHVVDISGIRIGDFLEVDGLYRQIKNMVTPRQGVKVLHFHFGLPSVAEGTVTVHREIQRIHPAKRQLRLATRSAP